MADIQSSLRRLQESIRGLSDASALVGAAPTGPSSVVSREDASGGSRSSGKSRSSENGLIEIKSRRSGDAPRPRSTSTSSASTTAQQHHQRYHGENNRSVTSEVSSRGGSGDGDSGRQHQEHPLEQSFLLSSLGGDVRDSAEMRAARELEDLRLEKESLQLMKKQLAAVHQLRVDLQRKESVIQSLQLKVQQGQSAKDRADRLETHCHLLEDRCSYLESVNGDSAERLGALDQESRARIDELQRDADDLRRHSRGLEEELQAEQRRAEVAATAHRRELGVALSEGAGARGLVEDLQESLKEASNQAKRRQQRFSEMENLLTSQLEETRASLAQAERRAVASSDARRRDLEAAATAAACLSRHLKAREGDEGRGRYAGGEDGTEERKESGTLGSPGGFVELSGKWCGNEILASTWPEVSKALEALDGARASEGTALRGLKDANRQVEEQQQRVGVMNRALEDERAEAARLGAVETRLASTTAQLESRSEDVRKRDRLVDAAWTQLAFLGVISSTNPSLKNASVAGDRGEVRGDGDWARAAGDLGFDTKEADVSGGLKRLASEWRDRGKAVETLEVRAKNEGARRDGERARLETLAEAAREEAEGRGEELARAVMEFESRAVCAEGQMSEKLTKVRADLAAEADRRIQTITDDAARKVGDALADADQRISATLEDATISKEKIAADAEERVSIAEKAVARAVADASAAEGTAAAAVDEAKGAVERRRSAEAALRVLGRFVGPLHRLCLELREQKRFLSRRYRRDGPLQAELFAIAAAVSGKDYWTLSCRNSMNSDTSSSSSSSSSNNNTSTTNGRRRPLRHNNITTIDAPSPASGSGASPPDIPPSLRAVVIAVIAANRLARVARMVSRPKAADTGRHDFSHENMEGNVERDGHGNGNGNGNGNENGSSRRGGERGAVAVGSAVEERQDYGGRGKGTDSRYMAYAGGVRSLPVLPPWRIARDLSMPRAEELRALPDVEALEAVLARLLVFDYGEGERGDGELCDAACSARISASAIGGGGVPKMEALWGGGGQVGYLLCHLLRGRKDHMTRVKERGLALDPRPSRHWNALRGDGGNLSFAVELEGGGHEASASAAVRGQRRGHGDGGWRVMLGRAVRYEMERSLWLGEGPGQPWSLHLRDIRKALAALAREVNASEAKRIRLEKALRSAGGGIGVRELEKLADVLQSRVGFLEAEVLSKPGEEAFVALQAENKKHIAATNGLREQVGRLEEDVLKARQDLQEASAKSTQASQERNKAEERAKKQEASRVELVGEVEQLKAFAHRANIEREECLEREKASAREKGLGVETGSSSTRFGGEREKLGERGAAVPEDHDLSFPQRQRRRGASEENLEREQRERRLAQSEKELQRCREEEDRSRQRCAQLEARLAEVHRSLEEQKSVTGSMRREAARAHGEAEEARKQAQDVTVRLSRQEVEFRREISVLEARVLETDAKNSRRRDLLRLQACAQDDLQHALKDAEPLGPVSDSSGREGLPHDITDASGIASDSRGFAIGLDVGGRDSC